MVGWIFEFDYCYLVVDFGSFDSVFVLEGECLICDLLFEVICIECDGVCYYVKCYCSVGKGLCCYLV